MKDVVLCLKSVSRNFFAGLQSIFMTEYLFLSDKNIKEIADTLFENTITATLGAKFDRKHCSVVTEDEKNILFNCYLKFLLRNRYVNNGYNITTLGS